MQIKWLGHACFLITSDSGTKIITDPYKTGGDLSYGRITESADIVTVSHDHFDHNNVAAVGGKPEIVRGTAKAKGIEFKGIASYHDEVKGSRHGPNTIFSFTVDGIKVCHLGDLGHQLSDKQLSEIGNLDLLLIPVGGNYTIDAKEATQVCNQLKPKVIIPMHFKTDQCDLPINGVDEFLKGKGAATKLDTSEVTFKLGAFLTATQIMVLSSAL